MLLLGLAWTCARLIATSGVLVCFARYPDSCMISSSLRVGVLDKVCAHLWCVHMQNFCFPIKMFLIEDTSLSADWLWCACICQSHARHAAGPIFGKRRARVICLLDLVESVAHNNASEWEYFSNYYLQLGQSVNSHMRACEFTTEPTNNWRWYSQAMPFKRV